MGRGTGRRLGAALAALALLTAACGDDDDDAGGGDTGEETTEVEALAVSAVDYAYEGLPGEIPGGVVEIELSNEGEAQHEIAFVEVGDVTAEQFFEDFAPYIEGSGPAPDYVTTIVGANEAAPGESTELVYTLPEGEYLAFCALTDVPGEGEGAEGEGAEGEGAEGEGAEGETTTTAAGGAEGEGDESTTTAAGEGEGEEGDEGEAGEGGEGAPHFTQGMVQPVTVTAPEGAAELPDADGTITALDYSFEADLEAGDTTINFTNDGPDQPHFAGFDRYEEGLSVEEAEAAFAALMGTFEGGELPEGTPEGEEVGFSGIATPGNGIQFQLPDGLEAGTYVFYCFISDLSGGPPHALPPDQGGKGMVKAIVVE